VKGLGRRESSEEGGIEELTLEIGEVGGDLDDLECFISYSKFDIVRDHVEGAGSTVFRRSRRTLISFFPVYPVSLLFQTRITPSLSYSYTRRRGEDTSRKLIVSKGFESFVVFFSREGDFEDWERR